MSRRGVPVVVLNGRISEKSARGYRRISFFMKKVFRQVSLFGMQSELDARRLQAAGADPARVVVTGNFKFDMERPAAAPSWTAVLKGPVIVAGSTFEGEEELVLSAYRENIARFPGLRLVLAPRHPERFAEAAELLRSSGVYFKRRSELPSEDGERAGVFLLDAMGELSAVYGVADIVIIGKSFSGYGGQNPLEPAYWGKAIICGPHMENFPFMGEFYEAGAAFEVEPTALAKKIRELLLDPGKAGSAGEKARALYEKNSGAVGRAMEVLKKYLP
jgi:3-deoxy-D-manno-octulosonic-acid transferase